MTGLRQTLGICVAFAALQAPAWATRPDELSDTFKLAVDMLQRGRKTEAAAALQKVLGMNPDQKAAYELWKSTEYTVWREFLVQGGDIQLSTQRLIELARMERKARRNDPEAIGKLAKDATESEDAGVRRRAVHTLASEHGEYATQYLIPQLAEATSNDKLVHAMYTLSMLGDDAISPLIEAMKSTNPIMRRNVAMVLGTTGSARGMGALQYAAAGDADEGVRRAAGDALKKLDAQGDALSSLLRTGDDYYKGQRTLREGASDVVWDWKDERLVAVPIPRGLYGVEMSRRAYFQALQANPASNEALAGVTRAYVDQQQKIEAMTAAGQDVGEWSGRVSEALMAVSAAGPEALDLALEWSVDNTDATTAGALCRVLGSNAKAPSAGLAAALQSSDGAIRSEAAVALGRIAVRTGSNAGADAVRVLGDAVSREVSRVALIISADESMSSALAGAMEGQGAYVNRSTSGLRGIAILRRAPALDVVLVADSLPDMAFSAVVDEVRNDERLKDTPIVVITKDAERISGAFGERINGTVSSADDLKAVEAALSKELTGDRALAQGLAARAADVLAEIAAGRRGQVGAVVDALASAVGREDKVAVPVLHALGEAGNATHAELLGSVLLDDKRTEGARAAAGRALATLLGRESSAVDAAMQDKIRALVSSDTARSVREAAAQALGNVTTSPEQRVELLRRIRN